MKEETKQYGISEYGNVWFIGDAYKGGRDIMCNGSTLTLHYEIASLPVLEEGSEINTSDHFTMNEIKSATIIKVVDLTEEECQKLQEALKALHNAYGAIKISQDPINSDLLIEGIIKDDYEIVGHISERGTIKEYEIQPNTLYKSVEQQLNVPMSAFLSKLSEEREISDDDETKILCDVLQRLPLLEKETNIEELIPDEIDEDTI
jgi:hypothetical protein